MKDTGRMRCYQQPTLPSAPPSEPPQEPSADTVLQNEEESAVDALIDQLFAQPKQIRMRYSIKVSVSVKPLGRKKIPRWTLNNWIKKKEDIFAFRGSEKTLSRAPGCAQMLPFRVELIPFMKDTRRESRSLTASLMASHIRDENSVWVEDYIKEKDTSTGYEY
ncbi:Hypothetical protein PHPALM_8104 [Phytophthora palmivora]|uniref:Uncharacterized protein n=1 Tax=Phytophthora palmivora TaxID=4796 RepID=A0A2P4YAM4_9STRA|nr:Hypothetical protein PHPALM_8104 [Phytophthora palmivora]